ncbi:undecaprenyldiphospho-muramoylpentapeptide beta-N-acetylglucosaminyltransferase [Corynebacterium pseudopelargi]|uniref:UDP-N-acetylglucosamine--N-acetylmuramyl-(pentapeptide) pyrophosphoryl-undecaprenol N-acetylglucosamine transferase n=1 Tax=Corynebacterium pseudopelargi TaxID=2080757 RepID=A0A3G6IW91_9CORY|nr:undecaprenyldiphospho-muramoylpentapeptide beta-N-acetylglucosaminyltransferase [Corynebacterium pseudopelargi]AZA08928.1 UDP-N-acetylglucosamine--N-acetylmuramyl-(pentapeptide) pyrophosphoryl-undecaprenol N-acetylglucosamine transferase [Corynebacterium pseudopelargi]
MQHRKIVVAGGGTAGHIEPAMAVAEALRERGFEVIALGTERGLETTIVPERGFELALIQPVPVPRKLNMDLLRLPRRVWKAMRQSREVLKQADVLIGFGGYVAAPAYIAARSLRMPMLVHEANARAGMANKLGVWLGGMGLNAAPDSGMKGEVVGIPIRNMEDPDAKDRALKLWGLDPQRPVVLVTGGSQGAASINSAVAEGLDRVLEQGVQVLHSYGKKNTAPQAREGYVPVPYIEDMAAAYAIASLVVCRAGAMTVAENTAAGVPAVYVPLPHGNGEQGLNALQVVQAGGAQLVEDQEFDGTAFADYVTGILGDDSLRASMAKQTKESVGANAAEHIADMVVHITSED